MGQDVCRWKTDTYKYSWGAGEVRWATYRWAEEGWVDAGAASSWFVPRPAERDRRVHSPRQAQPANLGNLRINQDIYSMFLQESIQIQVGCRWGKKIQVWQWREGGAEQGVSPHRECWTLLNRGRVNVHHQLHKLIHNQQPNKWHLSLPFQMKPIKWICLQLFHVAALTDWQGIKHLKTSGSKFVQWHFSYPSLRKVGLCGIFSKSADPPYIWEFCCILATELFCIAQPVWYNQGM